MGEGTIQVPGTARMRAQRLESAWHVEEEEKAVLVRQKGGDWQTELKGGQSQEFHPEGEESSPSREKHHYTCPFVKNILYLFTAVLGLRCCMRAFSSCGSWALKLGLQ